MASNRKDSTLKAIPTKNCQICGAEFAKPYHDSRKTWEGRLFCSKSCANSRPSGVEGRTIEGITHGTISSYNDHGCRCFECRAVAREYRRRSRDGILVPKEELGRMGEDNPLWKGEDVSYTNLHTWVARHKAKTGTCLHCGEERATQWANIDHQYRRDLDDFIELCPSCHKKYDLEHNFGKRVA